MKRFSSKFELEEFLIKSAKGEYGPAIRDNSRAEKIEMGAIIEQICPDCGRKLKRITQYGENGQVQPEHLYDCKWCGKSISDL